MELPEYVLEPVRKDEEFVLYRGEHSSQTGFTVCSAAGSRVHAPALETLKKIAHEYSLRNELDAALGSPKKLPS